MNATGCNPHGAQPTLTYGVRLTECALYSLSVGVGGRFARPGRAGGARRWCWCRDLRRGCRITARNAVVDSEPPCTPVRWGGTALALLVCERRCGIGMKSMVDTRQAAHLSRCPTGPVLQHLANLSLGENLERPVGCSRHAYMLKETRRLWSRPAPGSDVGQGKTANAKPQLKVSMLSS
jgi:hypothetical protein